MLTTAAQVLDPPDGLTDARFSTFTHRISDVATEKMSGKKFRFSLESVLQLRRHETERAEHELARLTAASRVQEEEVEQARTRLAEVWRGAPGRGTIGPQALRQHDTHRRQMQEAVEAAERRLAELREEVARVRRHLQEMRRAEEGLQTLREREQARHQREQALADAAFLDEQAVMRYCRQEETQL